MADASGTVPQRAGRSADYRPWLGLGALAFVLLTLASLVAVPALVQRRVTILRSRIEAAEPARTLVRRLQLNLARALLIVSEVRTRSAAAYAAAYADARAEERKIYEELAPLVARLGGDSDGRLADVRARADLWHDRLPRGDTALRRPAGRDGVVQLTAEREAFNDVLAAVAALDAAILRTTAGVRAEITAAEQTGLRLTYVLGLVALLAGIIAGSFEVRVRRLAVKAERRRLEAEAALAEAARATEARARLLRGITHDVKNPLGTARGYAELLELGVKAPLHPAQTPLVNGVVRSVDRALAIIADLLDLTRAESGGLRVDCVPAELNAVARDAVHDHRAAAEAAGHALEFEPTSRPLQVHTDPARVVEVLGNLLSNAIKYTPAPGRVTVTVERLDLDDGPRTGLWATVRVTDTGPGIPAELREAIFDEFTRLQEGTRIMGHGLGLAIARRIAVLLGGDLTVAEAPESGACFVLWLPRRDDGHNGSA